MTIPILETQPCSRCGGSGEYSYCQMYGRMCFKCSGNGRQLTKRGRVVAAWIKEQRSIPAGQVHAGQRVIVEDFFKGKTVTFTVTGTVRDMEEERNGYIPTISLHSQYGAHFGLDCTIKVLKVITPELRERARTYRDSLTLQGKPRKPRKTKAKEV